MTMTLVQERSQRKKKKKMYPCTDVVTLTLKGKTKMYQHVVTLTLKGKTKMHPCTDVVTLTLKGKTKMYPCSDTYSKGENKNVPM